MTDEKVPTVTTTATTPTATASSTPTGEDILKDFEDGISQVKALLEFDKELLTFCVEYLRNASKEWRQDSRQANSVLGVIKVFENARTQKSLKPKFEIIANQCVVLLVSYFSATLYNLFRTHVARAVICGIANEKAADFEIKISVKTLSNFNQDALVVGSMIAERRGYNFQNMEQICDCFEGYFMTPLSDKSLQGISDIVRIRNDVQVALACRNVIVHQGTLIDDRFVRQIRSAAPRTLFPELQTGIPIQFSSDEVLLVAERMEKFVAYIYSDMAVRLASQESHVKALKT